MRRKVKLSVVAIGYLQRGFNEIGRLSAKHLRRILAAGARPSDPPVEQIDKFLFVINLKTARDIYRNWRRAKALSSFCSE